MIVFLSLYLLLLAFFILLNSISQREATRMEAAIGSIDATFKSSLQTDLEAQPFAHMPGLLAGETALEARLRRLFQAHLPVGRYEVYRRVGRLEVGVPGDRIFESGSAAFRPSRTALFEALAEALTRRAAANDYELEVLVETGAAPAPGRRLELARAAAIAADLSRRGVPVERLSTGLEEGAAGRVRFVFLPRDGDRGVDPGAPTESR